MFGRLRVSGPDPEHRSYHSFASFSDPDGNGWLLKEVTTRLAGRIDSATTTFASANDLASALRRARAVRRRAATMNDYDVIIFDRALRVLAAFRCQYGDRSSLKKLPRVAAFRRNQHQL